MSTESQTNANQLNAQHSTGPTTDAGKSASSRNSQRHGLSGVTLIMLPHESAEAFIEFANNLRAEHIPVTPTEDTLVAKMAASAWMSIRAINMQSMLLAQSPNTDNQQFALFLRYQSVHDRAFSKALSDLQSLRKQEIGFVPQNTVALMQEAKIRSMNARSEAIESTTQVRKHRNAPVFAAATAAPGVADLSESIPDPEILAA